MARRGRSFVKNMRGWGTVPGRFVIGFYMWERGRKLGFVPQSGAYFRASDARKALRRGSWKRP